MANWHLDEQAFTGEEHLDPDYVAAYERKAGFEPTEDVEILRRHGLGRDSVVVDMGAGAGVLVAAVAPLCREVIAVDISPEMVAAMHERMGRQGLDNVTIVESGHLSYEHLGEPVDVVYSRNALHQVPDFWKALALERFARTLKPGGIARLRDLVFDFEPADAPERMAAWMAGAVEDPVTGYTADEPAERAAPRDLQ